jgi:cell division protein FtsL
VEKVARERLKMQLPSAARIEVVELSAPGAVP